jgi:hypothetical protein
MMEQGILAESNRLIKMDSEACHFCTRYTALGDRHLSVGFCSFLLTFTLVGLLMVFLSFYLEPFYRVRLLQ